MKRSSLSAAGIVGLATAGLLIPTAAEASPPRAWSAVAPEIALVGDLFVDDGKATTDDATPRIYVDSTDSSHIGATLRVRDASSGRTLCEGAQPVQQGGGFFYSMCTPAALPLGVTEVEAVFVSMDGENETESARVALRVVPQRFDIDVTAYDPAADRAILTGSGPAGDTIQVGQDLDAGGPMTMVQVPESGVWTKTVDHPENLAFELRYERNGRTWYGVTAFSKSAPLKPTVTASVEGGQVIVDVASGDNADRIDIHDSDWRLIASSDRTGTVTRLSFRAPAGEANYTAQALSAQSASVAAWFSIKMGEGSRVSGAPLIDDVSRTGSKAVVTTTAEAGSVVSVTDSSGKVLAARMAGRSGVAHLSFAVPPAAKADSEFFVTQSKGGQTSDRDDFQIPSL